MNTPPANFSFEVLYQKTTKGTHRGSRQQPTPSTLNECSSMTNQRCLIRSRCASGTDCRPYRTRIQVQLMSCWVSLTYFDFDDSSHLRLLPCSYLPLFSPSCGANWRSSSGSFFSSACGVPVAKCRFQMVLVLFMGK